MPSYNSEEMIQRYGLKKGLELLNALTAVELGVINDQQLRRFMHRNISFFFPNSLPRRYPFPV